MVGERHLRGKQGRLVFAYLVCEHARPVFREELATVVWPENMSPSWEGALSSLTSKLRTLLSANSLVGQTVSLSHGFHHYQVHLPADVRIDLEAGTSALDRAEAALRAGQPASALDSAVVAA